MKLFDSELKVMQVLWENGDASAKDIAAALGRQVGWSKTTSYTVIKKCIDKGAVSRTDPGFMCHAEVTLEDARAYETDELISKMYNGSADMLAASLLSSDRLSSEEIARLKELIGKLK
ncbi:MAG: BlaI/MecI/CopY family transcriptional regulator [Eubacterium sp.]|nr:BlaI/MecI/CopY family transcriptional regulator [Eubacterium sp.]